MLALLMSIAVPAQSQAEDAAIAALFSDAGAFWLMARSEWDNSTRA
ncbi:MAG: hypothetical protein WBG92_10385 [Thiohalocapsa sp.]